jgi:hypothetical protein
MASWQRIEQRNATSRRVVRGLVLVVVIVVLVVAVPGFFDVLQPRLQGDAPAAAVRQLCAGELHQEYVAVYALLSSSFIQQYQLTEAGFVQAQRGRDDQVGLVVACAIMGRDYVLSLFNLGAEFQVTITLSGGPTPHTDTGPIGLVDDNGWKVSSEGIDAALAFTA